MILRGYVDLLRNVAPCRVAPLLAAICRWSAHWIPIACVCPQMLLECLFQVPPLSAQPGHLIAITWYRRGLTIPFPFAKTSRSHATVYVPTAATTLSYTYRW